MSNDKKPGSEMIDNSSGWAGIGRMIAEAETKRNQLEPSKQQLSAQPQLRSPIIISQAELMASQNEGLKLLKRNEFILLAVAPDQEIDSQILRSNVKQISSAQNNIPVLIKRGDEAYIYRNIGEVIGRWELTKFKDGLLTKIQDFPRVGDNPMRSKSMRNISESLYNEIITEIRGKNAGGAVQNDLFHIPMAAALNDAAGTLLEQVIEALGQFFTDLNRGLKINGVDGKTIIAEIEDEARSELVREQESTFKKLNKKELDDEIKSKMDPNSLYLKNQILQRVAWELKLDLTDVTDRKLLILLGKSYSQEVLNLLPSCIQGAIEQPVPSSISAAQAATVQSTTHSPKTPGRVGKLLRSSPPKQTLESPVFIVDNLKSVKTANFISDKLDKNTRVSCIVELDNIHIKNTAKPEEPLIYIPGKLKAEFVLTDKGFYVEKGIVSNELLKKLVVSDHDIKNIQKFAREVSRSLMSTWFDTKQSPPSSPASPTPPSPPPSVPPSPPASPPPLIPLSEETLPLSPSSPFSSIASLFLKEDKYLDEDNEGEGRGDFALEVE